MTIVYVVNVVNVVSKKRGGYSIKHDIQGAYKNPSQAQSKACKIITRLLEKEHYFVTADDDANARKDAVDEIMKNEDPPAGKYYDLDNLMYEWSGDIPDLQTKKYDVHVTETKLS